MTDNSNRYYMIILCSLGLILTACVYLSCTRGLSETLEAESAEIAREFTEGSSLVINHLNGREDLDKPPLFYWAIALSSKITPDWEIAARLPSLVSAGLIMFLFFRLSMLPPAPPFMPRSPRPDPKMLFAVSSLVFLTSPKVFWMSQIARIDMSFTGACFFSIYAFCQYLEKTDRSEEKQMPQGAPWGFFISSAAAVMLKGPVGAIITFIPAGLFLILEKRWRLMRHVFLGKGMLFFLLIAVPWFVAATLETDFRFFHRFILEENLSRFTDLIPGGTYKDFNYSPLTRYPVYFLTGFFPWSLIVPFWIWDVVRNWKRQDDISRLLFIYIVFVFCFFSAAISKRSDYILPLYPAAAFLSTRYLLTEKGSTIMRFLSAAVFTLVIMAGAGLSISALLMGHMEPQVILSHFSHLSRPEVPVYFLKRMPEFLPAFLILFLAGLSGIYFCLKSRNAQEKEGIFSAYALHVAIIFLLAGLVFLPAVYRQKDARKFCQGAARIIAGRPLYYFGFWDEECTFYLHRHIPKLSHELFEEKIKRKDKIFLILEEEEFGKLKGRGISFPFVYRKDTPLMRPLVLVSNKN